jgi:hypothetical protein
MKGLKKIRAIWESTAIQPPVMYRTDGTVIVVMPLDGQLYRIIRYFKIGETWNASVDQSGAIAITTFNVLAALINKPNIN